MSDFVSRLAARAVGHASAARPRLPSRYEEPGPERSDGLEVESNEVVVGTPAALPGTTGPANSREREPIPAPGRKDPAPPVFERAHQVAGVTEPQANRIEPLTAASSNVGLFGDTVWTEAAPEPGNAEDRPGAIPAPPARTRSVAMPAIPMRSDDPIAVSPEPPHAEAQRPQQVRVHIGRIEVRANLVEAAARVPQGRNDERSPGPSLAEYLRGSGEAP